MTEKPDAWMPLYVGDWDSGTRHLDCEQDGAYGRLVRHYWRNGPLPDDDLQLARIVGISRNKWQKLRAILAAFFVIEAGRWNHKRVDEELAKWTERKANAIRRAVAGGHAKAAKNPASSTPQALLEGCSSSSPDIAEASKKASASIRKRSGERAPDGRSPSVWQGPPDLRAAVVAAKGEAWTSSYLDPCAWQDVPVRGVVPRSAFASRKLEQEAIGVLLVFDAAILAVEKEIAA